LIAESLQIIPAKNRSQRLRARQMSSSAAWLEEPNLSAKVKSSRFKAGPGTGVVRNPCGIDIFFSINFVKTAGILIYSKQLL